MTHFQWWNKKKGERKVGEERVGPMTTIEKKEKETEQTAQPTFLRGIWCWGKTTQGGSAKFRQFGKKRKTGD